MTQAPPEVDWSRLVRAARSSLPYAAVPDGFTLQSIVALMLETGQARGLLRFEPPDGLRFTPLGAALAGWVVPVCNGDPTGWAAAVRAMDEAEPHPDPASYFAELDVGAPASSTSEKTVLGNLDAAERIWGLVQQMELRVGRDLSRVHTPSSIVWASVGVWVERLPGAAGARRMIMEALRTEEDDYITAARAELERDERGRRLVVRNGSGKARSVTLGCGMIEVEAPLVKHQREPETGEERHFTSGILARDARRSPELQPVLHLCGPSSTRLQARPRGAAR